MGVITGRIVDSSGPTALPVPTVGQRVENVVALRSLTGSVADLPAVSLMQWATANPFLGGGTFAWDTNSGVDDGGRRLNAGGEGSSGIGWQKVGVRPDDIDVTEYGAACDGVTDDSTAVQRAHDALPSAGGRLVFPGLCKCGDLVFDRPVEMVLQAGLTANASPLLTTNRNLAIRGIGEGTTTITVQAAGTGILLTGAWGDTDEGEPAVHIARLRFSGGARHIDASNLTGFNEGDFHCEHVTFDSSTGISVELDDSVYYGRFTRCQWVQCYTWAKIHSYTETKFTHSVMKQSNTGGPGLHLFGAHHTEMHFCQLYGFAPNVNPDILIEPTNNGAQGYLELHRVKFGAEREYWHRKSRPRIQHAGGVGEEHFVTTAVRLRFCEFLGPAALVLSSVGRSSNVATATVTSNIAGGHGMEVGDRIHVIGVSDTSYCGEHTITAKATNTISWASTGADDGQSDLGGFVASAELAAIHMDSPGADWVYDSNLFYAYTYAVKDTFTEKMQDRGTHGHSVWLPGNRVYGPLGKGASEFEDGGRGFAYVAPQLTSNIVPFTTPRVVESAAGLINRAPRSEALDTWGALGCTATTGESDPWGTTRACLVARDGSNMVITGAGGGGFTLLEGLARSFEQSSPPLGDRGFVSLWAKAGTARTLFLACEDGSGALQFQHNLVLGDDWKRYVIPVVWKNVAYVMQMILCPGGNDAEVSDCYVTGFQVSDEDTDYLPTGATFEQTTTVGARYELGVEIAGETVFAKDGVANRVAGWDINGAPAARQKYYTVPIISTTTVGALSLTVHDNTERALANDDHYNQRGLYLAEYTEYRLHVTITGNSTSVNDPRLYVQYSDDDSAWSDADAGPATISLATTGRKVTAWTSMAAGMQVNDIYLRVAMNGGDGAEEPFIRDCWVEFR